LYSDIRTCLPPGSWLGVIGREWYIGARRILRNGVHRRRSREEASGLGMRPRHTGFCHVRHACTGLAYEARAGPASRQSEKASAMGRVTRKKSCSSPPLSPGFSVRGFTPRRSVIPPSRA
jgi:hypothetical protein